VSDRRDYIPDSADGCARSAAARKGRIFVLQPIIVECELVLIKVLGKERSDTGIVERPAGKLIGNTIDRTLTDEFHVSERKALSHRLQQTR
jgi:hypothetical protein